MGNDLPGTLRVNRATKVGSTVFFPGLRGQRDESTKAPRYTPTSAKVCRYQVLLLVDVRDVAAVCLLADHLRDCGQIGHQCRELNLAPPRKEAGKG